MAGVRREHVQNKRFFDLPLAAKEKSAHPPEPNPHRGYSYLGQEKLSKVKDYEKGSRNAIDVFDVKVTPTLALPHTHTRHLRVQGIFL